METCILEKILLLSTRDPSHHFTCVYMEDSLPLTNESLDIILFERLLLDNPLNNIRNLKDNPKLKEDKLEVVGRKEVVLYLLDVYERCLNYKNSVPQIVSHIQSSVLTNLATALDQPELFNEQQPDRQLRNLILNHFSESACLREIIINLIENNNQDDLPSHKKLFEEVCFLSLLEIIILIFKSIKALLYYFLFYLHYKYKYMHFF